MATVRQDKVQIEIEINGKQVKNTLADLNASYRQLNREIRNLTPGTEEFNKKAQEIAKAKAALDNVKKSVQAFQQETKKAADESKSLGQNLAELPGRISTAFQRMLGPLAGIMAGIGLKEFVGDLFNSAAQMEAFEAKAATVFGEALGTVEEFASRNANAMGMTRREYVATAAAAGDLLIPMGFQREEAARLSTDLVDLSGALSEWSGGQRSSAEVSEILTKALLGEREQLKSLGIAIQEADVTQRLLEKGQKDLTGTALQQAKALATLELIMEKSTDAQEAYEKNTGSLLRRQAQWRAYFQDLRDGFVKSVIPGISAAADWFGELLGVGDKLSDQWEQERIAMNALVMEITNVNTPTERRKELIEELNRQYPDFLENLDQETVSNEELTGRLKEVNEQLINKILIQRQAEDIDAAQRKAADAGLQAIRAETELRKELVSASEKYGIVLDQNKTLQEQAQDAFEKLNLSGSGLIGIINGQVSAAGRIKSLLLQNVGFAGIQNEQTEISNQLQQERLTLLKELGITLEETETKEKKRNKNRQDNLPLTDAEIKAIKEKLKVEQEIQRLTISLMQEGQEKEIAQLRQQAQERITALTGTSEQVKQQQMLIEQKLQMDISRVRQDYAGKEIERLRQEARDRVQALKGSAEEVIQAQAEIESQLQTDVLTLISSTEQEQIEVARANAEARKEVTEQNSEQVKLIEEQLQVDITSIITRSEKLRQDFHKESLKQTKEDAQKSYEEQLKELEKFEKTKRQIEATQQAIEAVQAGRDPKEVEQELKDDLLQIELSFLEAKKDLAEQYGLNTVEIQKQIEDLRLGIITAGIQRENTERKKGLEKFENDVNGVLQAASQLAAGIDQLNQLSYEAKLSRIEQAERKELEMAGDNEKKKAAIEAKYQKQKEAAQVQAAKKQKAISSVQTVINTAESIVRTGAQLGYPAAIPFQVIAAAVGLAQLQKINSQTFARGGYTGQPGPGVIPDRTGQKPAGIVHEGEWVAPKWMLQSPAISPIIAELESIRERKAVGSGKVDAIRDELTRLSPANVNYITNTYADGGVVTTPSDLAVTAARMDTSSELLISEIKGLKQSLNTIQFVTVWGEREAVINSAADAALSSRRSKGIL